MHDEKPSKIQKCSPRQKAALEAVDRSAAFEGIHNAPVKLLLCSIMLYLHWLIQLDLVYKTPFDDLFLRGRGESR